MISLVSELTDGKGRHARGWLFFDAECEFCTSIAKGLIGPMRRRGLAVAALQDPRVGALLGLSREDLLSSLRFISDDGTRYSGSEAVFAVAREFWWGHPLLWMSGIPGVRLAMRTTYRWIARRRSCPAAAADASCEVL